MIKRAIADAKEQGRKGLVLTCKDRLISYYARFGFKNEGVSESIHGNVVWNQMRLTFDEGWVNNVKKNRFEIDMCNGSIMDKLISFSLPLMVSGILQLAFNAVDIIVVGRFSGSQALAAVGSTTALINVFTNCLSEFRLAQCSCSQILCSGQRPGDVGNSTYFDHTCADQWNYDGSYRGASCKVGA